MKNKVRRTILLLLIAVILFSASMAIPALQDSIWKQLLQGAAIGLMFAGVISVISALIDYFKSGSTTK